MIPPLSATARLTLGLGLLAALGVGTHLFITGRITLPAARSDPATWGSLDGRGSTSWFFPAIYPSYPKSAEEAGLPPLLQRKAVARHVSHDGRHAFILSETPEIGRGYDYVSWGRPACVLVRMAPGAVGTAWDAYDAGAGASGELPTVQSLVGEGNTVRFQGMVLFSHPLVQVLDDGGFVLTSRDVDGFYGLHSEAIVHRHDHHGDPVWVRTAGTLVADGWPATLLEGPSLFSQPSPSWQHGMWVDEPRGLLVLVDTKDALHALSLADGRSRADVDEIALTLSAIRDGFPADRVTALNLALVRGWEEGLPAAREVLADVASPEHVRLRAACLLALHGDLSGRDLVAEVARRPPQQRDPRRDDVSLAWQHLGRFLGVASFPLYIERLRLPAQEHLDSIDAEIDGLAAVGDEALTPAVALMLEVPEGSTLFRRYQRLLDALRTGDSRGTPQKNEEPQARWDLLRRDGAVEDLSLLLNRWDELHYGNVWLVLVLPAARWAALHPRPEYVEPLRTFRAAFAADPQCRDGWRDRVLAEVDAALAACAGG